MTATRISVVICAALGLLAAAAIYGLPPTQITQWQATAPSSRSVLEEVQGVDERVRLGELSMSTEYSGWVTYRYQDPVKGFAISFPPDWSIGERPTSEGSDEVATVDVFRRPNGFNRIEVHLTDMDTPFGFGPRYYLERLSNATPTAVSILGEDSLLFDDITISYVDGSIPILGKLIYFPDRSIVIRVSEQSSYEPDNSNRELIDVEATQAVLETFHFIE